MHMNGASIGIKLDPASDALAAILYGICTVSIITSITRIGIEKSTYPWTTTMSGAPTIARCPAGFMDVSMGSLNIDSCMTSIAFAPPHDKPSAYTSPEWKVTLTSDPRFRAGQDCSYR
jgi:hypothetical protein